MNARKHSHANKSINYRIYTLASSISKGAQAYYSKRFAVGIPEMRILSTIDSDGPLSATEVVDLTAMDKGLVSRILKTLHQRKLIMADASSSDPRRRSWSLSSGGRDLVATLRPIWKRREAVLQSCLTEPERILLGDMLERLLLASEDLRRREAGELLALNQAPTPD